MASSPMSSSSLAAVAVAMVAAAPVLLFIAPFIIFSIPILTPAFLSLALAQTFVPHRLPHWLAESRLAATAASLLSSWLRLLRKRMDVSLAHSPSATTRALVNQRSAEPKPKAGIPSEQSLSESSAKYGLDSGTVRSRVRLIASVEANGQYELLQTSLKRLVQEDAVVTLSHSTVQQWLGRRWRNLFIQYASRDADAVHAASRPEFFGLRADSRPVEQRVAERFLKGKGVREWADAVPGGSSHLPPAPDLSAAGHSNETLVLWCPGLVNGMLPVRGFNPSLAELQQETGINVLRAALHPLRGCAENAEDVRRALEEGVGLKADLTPMTEPPPPHTAVIAICYSKGMPDFLEFLLQHPEWRNRVKCIFSWAGAIGGSPLADNVWSSIGSWDLNTVMRRLSEVLDWLCPIVNLRQGPLERVDEMRLKDAVLELSVAHRQAWLREHMAELARMNVPVFCITGSTTLQDVAYFNASGWVLLNMYDGNNDMQLTQECAKLEVPLAMHLGMLNANHWDMTYGSFPAAMALGSRKLNHQFPKRAALNAMIALAHELGFL